MEPVESSSYHQEMWSRARGPSHKVKIGGAAEGLDVIPCPALVFPEDQLVMVQWQLNEIELAALAQGGTLWLTCWGGLPIHTMEVIPKENPNGSA